MIMASPLTTSDPLLPPGLLSKLERLSLQTRRRVRGQMMGARRSRRHGASVEFSDYRDYVQGDDLRTVDWRAYGRLEKLIVKLFHEEDDLSLHLLLDASASMAVFNNSNAPAKGKLRFGQELCAAFGAVALMEFDRCTFAAVSGGAATPSPPLRGRSSLRQLLAALGRVQARDVASIETAIHAYAQTRTAPGVLIVISDFYDHGLTAPLLARAGRNLDIVLAHVVQREEIDPAAAFELSSGDVRLIDSETGASVEVTLTPALLDAYRAEFADFCDNLQATAHAGGAAYLRISTDTSVEDAIMNEFRRRKILA